MTADNITVRAAIRSDTPVSSSCSPSVRFVLLSHCRGTSVTASRRSHEGFKILPSTHFLDFGFAFTRFVGSRVVGATRVPAGAKPVGTVAVGTAAAFGGGPPADTEADETAIVATGEGIP